MLQARKPRCRSCHAIYDRRDRVGPVLLRSRRASDQAGRIINHGCRLIGCQLEHHDTRIDGGNKRHSAQHLQSYPPFVVLVDAINRIVSLDCPSPETHMPQNTMWIFPSLLLLRLLGICTAAFIPETPTIAQPSSLAASNLTTQGLSGLFDWPQENSLVHIRGTESTYLHITAYGPSDPYADKHLILNALIDVAYAVLEGPPPSRAPVTYKEGPVTLHVMFMDPTRIRDVVLSAVVGMFLQWAKRNGVRNVRHADIGFLDVVRGFDVVAAVRLDVRVPG